jgi:hypothetical protein
MLNDIGICKGMWNCVRLEEISSVSEELDFPDLVV